jgi:hypothetical protein
MVVIVRLYTLKLVNYYNMQIQFDVEISNTIAFIDFFTVSNNTVTYVVYTVQCYTTRSRAQTCYLQTQLAKSQHPLHIMGYGTPTPTPAEDHTYHA